MLRGVAVLAVLAHNAPWPMAVRTSSIGPIISIGAHGVDLFFVLSGFLISGLLLAEFDQFGTLNIRRFWIRRWFKICPAYYVAYLIPVAYVVLCGGVKRSVFINMWPNILLVQNYIHVDLRWFASWSLAVEEHFYLALPLVFFVLGRRAVIGLCLGAIVICPIFRWLQSDVTTVYLQTHTRADALAVGVLLSYFWRYRSAAVVWGVQRFWPFFGIMPFVSLSVAYAFPVQNSETPLAGRSITYSVLAFGFAGWVAIAAVSSQWNMRGANALAVVGAYSYTIYLAQFGAQVATAQASSLLGWHPVASFLLSSVLGGILLSVLVEHPALWVRERLTRSHLPKNHGGPTLAAG